MGRGGNGDDTLVGGPGNDTFIGGPGTNLIKITCEACGDTDGPFEMHHVHALKDKQGEPFTVLKRAARHCKTTVLCRRCHVAIHAGRMASRAESHVR